MNYGNLKLKVGFLVLTIVFIPLPVVGLILWWHSLLFKGMLFYLFLPFSIIISLLTYIVLMIFLAVIMYKTGAQIKEGVFKLNSKETYAWLKSIVLNNMIGMLTRIGIPNSALRKLYSWIFPTKLGRTLVMEGIVEHSLVDVGDNTIIGHEAEIWGHMIEGDKIIIKKVRIGNNCTIGAKSVIMPGAVIGDNTIVGAMSLVPKNKVLKPNSVYVGVPARRIKKNNL